MPPPSQAPTIDLAGRLWAGRLYQPARYKILWGGRGGGKSWAIAEALVWLASTQRVRIACTREFQNSIAESAKALLERIIVEYGALPYWKLDRERLTHRLTGSVMFFRGLERNRQSIRGWQDVDIVWIEEAHSMAEESWQILRNTIRAPGSEIWFSFNPENRTDPAWKEVLRRSSRSYIRRVNFNDNPFFPDDLEGERQDCLKYTPELYGHDWLGQPNDAGAGRKVLPFELLKKCEDAWAKYKHLVVGRPQVGLDVADQGIDLNALVARTGPGVTDCDPWHGGTLGKTARRAHAFCKDRDAIYLCYDAGGLGAGIRSHMVDIHEKEGIDYYLVPANFGGKVSAPKTIFSRSTSNEMMFARRGGQLAWGVRLRAEATASLLEGENVDPEMCLFINPAIRRVDEFLAELSQPEWEEDSSGRVRIVKAKPGEPSPDKYDGTVLAYESDSRSGLRQHHYGPM